MSSQLKILVGILFTVLTCIPLAVVAYNDLGPGFGIAPNVGKTVMEKRGDALYGREIEVGADLFGTYCSTCHGAKGEGIPQVAPALNRKDLFDGRRQKDVGWAGSVSAFLKDTIAAGRPVASRPDLYVARMPTWSQEFGGPMRPDQIDALVAHLLNWKGTAPEVNAWPPPGTPQPTPTPGPSPTPAPTRAGVSTACQNVPAPFAGKKSPYNLDDRSALAAGKATFDNQCAACHGTTGRGDGPAAAALSPKPANFNDKAFMQGIPIDCHFWRISEGVVGTGMPPWRALGEDTIWKVLIYERSFSGVR